MINKLQAHSPSFGVGVTIGRNDVDGEEVKKTISNAPCGTQLPLICGLTQLKNALNQLPADNDVYIKLNYYPDQYPDGFEAFQLDVYDRNIGEGKAPTSKNKLQKPTDDKRHASVHAGIIDKNGKRLEGETLKVAIQNMFIEAFMATA
ncbi:hypothetical protein tpqmel_0416, partial [Candidatus Gastranaerophilus sp. (ex Termes propinquus)]